MYEIEDISQDKYDEIIVNDNNDSALTEKESFIHKESCENGIVGC